MTEIVDIADLDCIYLTYDEPQKDEFWAKILNMVPWAIHIDGIEGSDAAHKAAARASPSGRFVLIDGDNLPDPEFFNLQLTLDDVTKHCVFRWKGRNIINGLMYGNGGLSCWPVDFVLNMTTHENTDGSDETFSTLSFVNLPFGIVTILPSYFLIFVDLIPISSTTPSIPDTLILSFILKSLS